MYAKIVKQLHIWKMLLTLSAKNVAANKLQYVSNKPNKQTEIYILRLSFKTQLKDWVFCPEWRISKLLG